MKSYDLEQILHTNDAEEVSGSRTGKFWSMASFEGGGTWIGKWKGESPWERHSSGDEFIHVLKGKVEVELITASGKQSVTVPQGHISVVPKNHWHKQIAQTESIVLGATPGITDHTETEPSFP